MRRIKKTVVFMVLLLCLVLLPSMIAQAGFRRMSNGKFRYYTTKTKYIKKAYKNITTKGKTYTYYFDKDGYMITGWKKLKASDKKWYWYYFDRNGRMYKNRTKNGHYLQSNGQMLVNDWHNGVYYGADGSAVPGYREDVKNGFQKTKKGTKYMKANGEYAVKEWLCIKDSLGKQYWYYFYSTGYMAQNTWVGSKWVDEHGRYISSKKRSA